MFRRMYLTISALLVLSTGLLLVILGVVVYRELDNDLTRDSEQSMRMQMEPVTDAVRDSGPEQFQGEASLRDDRGDSILYYGVTDDGVISSPRSTIPFSVVKNNVHLGQFSTIVYNGQPYRLFSFAPVADDHAGPHGQLLPDPDHTDTQEHKPVQLYMYTLITQETAALHHASRLMVFVGGVGFLLALVGDLFLAQRFMRPTYRAWTAYRDTVLELSHELQTPLATVNAMMTSRGVEESTAADVRHEIERASRMVSDMLFLSRLRSGFSEQPTEPVAVSDITEELAERFTAHAQSQGLTVEGYARPGLFVETTPGEWERLISTLFQNVIDHADYTERTRWQLIHDGRRVKFSIENGIPKNVQDAGARPPERGVGLQIVQRLAKRMRGTVDVSRTGETFLVTVSVPNRRPHW